MSYALLTIGTVLFLTFVMSYVILRKTVGDKSLRRVLMVFIILTPPIAVFALMRGLFVRQRPIPYIEEIGRIEDEIETERASIFAEKVMRPSFSQRWRLSYLYAVEKSTVAAAKLGPSLRDSLCGIPQSH